MIFEPLNKIQLTCSTYQVTTFLDFAPFMNGFKNVQNYIKSFRADVANPTYFAKIKHKNTNMGSSPLLDDQDLEVFMQSLYCQQLPYACMMRLKIDSFLMEIDYLDELFDVVYRKFSNVIDHIEHHPTLQEESPSDTRNKWSTLQIACSFRQYEFYPSPQIQKNEKIWYTYLGVWMGCLL